MLCSESMHLLPIQLLIFFIKTIQFQHSNLSKFDKVIYNSISYTHSIVFASKLSQNSQILSNKQRTKSTKCPIINLKVACVQCIIIAGDIKENCVDSSAKFKLINPEWHMSLTTHTDRTMHVDWSCHQSMLKVNVASSKSISPWQSWDLIYHDKRSLLYYDKHIIFD